MPPLRPGPALLQVDSIVASGIEGHESDQPQGRDRPVSRWTAEHPPAAPLCTARWEEGWELPVTEWRRRLGIQHPANDETYGLSGPRP